MATVHERRRWTREIRRIGVCSAVLVIAVLACGATAPPADAIIGGQPAEPGYFGYIAFVGAAIGDGTAVYCTGALVAPSVVMTAAHCASLISGSAFSATAFTIGTGRLDLRDTSTGQVLGVSRVAVSPTWNPETRQGDVALLQLTQPSTAATLPIASASDAGWAYQLDSTIIVAGWGWTNPTPTASPQINWTDLSVQNEHYCARQYAAVYDSPSMFCASQPGSSAGACYGDSGAPAVAKSPSGVFEITGIASLVLGESCATPNLFTRVTSVSAWLNDEVAYLQATAPPAGSPELDPSAPPRTPASAALVPLAVKQARKPPYLRARPSTGAAGRSAKLEFWPGSNSGRLRVRVRVLDGGVVLYSKTTRYFQPTARVWALSWRVPRTLKHSVRFCMSATLLASDKSSLPSCSPLRIKQH
jgi:hypothetical protein